MKWISKQYLSNKIESLVAFLKSFIFRLPRKKVSATSNLVSYSQIYLENIIDRIPAFIFWKDPNSVYLGCNYRFANLVGKDFPHEVIGKTDFDLNWGKGEPELFLAGDQEVMNGNAKVNVEEMLDRPDGTQIVMLVSKVPLRDKEGNCIGILGISMDITERKEAEQKLLVATERAEAANKAKMEFLYNMRHDLRTPFSGVYSLSEHLEAGEMDPSKKEILGYIKNSAKMLLDQVNEILEFISSEEGSLPILDKEFDTHKLLVDMHDMFKPSAISQNIELVVSQEEDLPKIVIGDQVRTQRILISLLSNATKFTKTGYVKVYANLKKCDKRNIIISFVVEDTGIGIPEDKQDVIFERFNRLTSSYSGIYAGKGLGLRLVKRFLDELGGEVQVKSTLGEGSTFTILIPYKLPLLE